MNKGATLKYYYLQLRYTDDSSGTMKVKASAQHVALKKAAALLKERGRDISSLKIDDGVPVSKAKQLEKVNRRDAARAIAKRKKEEAIYWTTGVNTEAGFKPSED